MPTGRLPLPGAGPSSVLTFGEKTQYGGQSKGIVLETRQGAQVTSPCDGWIVYAGEFRSYGQLLIINAGGGYHMLACGLISDRRTTGPVRSCRRTRRHNERLVTAGPTGSREQCPCPIHRISQGWEAHRPRPMVGSGSSEGARIMRKTEFAFWTFLLMTGLAGATTLLNVTRTYSATSSQLRALPAARSVRRRAGAGALRLRREARRRDADRIRRSTACCRRSIRTPPT